MTTSPTTSESEIRTALLDVLYAQWREFGVPFTPALGAADLEVIDPEALLWCSLTFTSTEPRLAEGVHEWVAKNRTRINRPRLNKLVRTGATDGAAERLERSKLLRELGLSRTEPRSERPMSRSTKPLGDRSTKASSLLLRSRDVLGNDSRSFLIVHLLGNPRGVRLREVAASTLYSYRSLSEAAAGWARAGVLRIDRGHCVLTNPAPWIELLACDADKVILIDWPTVYEMSTRIMRALAKAHTRGFESNHPLIRSSIDASIEYLDIASPGTDASQTPALARLRASLESAVGG